MSYLYRVTDNFGNELLYTTSIEKYKEFISGDTFDFSPNHEADLEIYYKVFKVPLDKPLELDDMPIIYYAPNGQVLSVSPLDAYHYRKGLCWFEHKEITYIWNGEKWQTK